MPAVAMLFRLEHITLAARWVWAALDAAGRTTGMVENLNSVLAPHRVAHRGLPTPVLAVFVVYRNHRVFPQGKRAEYSPPDLLGLPSPHWLDILGYGQPPAPAPVAFLTRAPHTVNRKTARGEPCILWFRIGRVGTI